MTTEFRPEDGRPDPALSGIISGQRQLINLAYARLLNVARAHRYPRRAIPAHQARAAAA
jgi:hypothetical protein